MIIYGLTNVSKGKKITKTIVRNNRRSKILHCTKMKQGHINYLNKLLNVQFYIFLKYLCIIVFVLWL